MNIYILGSFNKQLFCAQLIKISNFTHVLAPPWAYFQEISKNVPKLSNLFIRQGRRVFGLPHVLFHERYKYITYFWVTHPLYAFFRVQWKCSNEGTNRG